MYENADRKNPSAIAPSGKKHFPQVKMVHVACLLAIPELNGHETGLAVLGVHNLANSKCLQLTDQKAAQQTAKKTLRDCLPAKDTLLR